MTYELDVFPERRLARVTIAGDIEGLVVFEAIEGLAAHPDWQPGFDMIWDGRAITFLAMMSRDVDAAVAKLADLDGRLGDGRSAVVLRRTVDLNMARLVLLRDAISRSGPPPRTRRLFESVGAALRWIEAGEPEVPSDPVTLLRQFARASRRGAS
jgi:hypothetical protein